MTGPINLFPVDRYWFLTWTTYGTWLPGDDRGYVGMAPDRDGRLVMHNLPNTPPAPPNPRLRRDAEASLKRTPVVLDITEAESLLEQFHETANHRRWLLQAVGIMHTHLHLVVGVPGDPDPDKVLGDFKAYGSRRLNQISGGPQGVSPRTASPTPQWTTGSSKRKLTGESSITAAIRYIRDQPNPLLIWTREDGITFSARNPAPPGQHARMD